MRKRGGNHPSSNNNHIKSNGNSSSAVSKLLLQNQNSNSSSSSNYRDGQSIILDVREPILAGSHTTTNGSSRGVTTSSNGDDHHITTTAQLNTKNHRLAKELVSVPLTALSSLSIHALEKMLTLYSLSSLNFLCSALYPYLQIYLWYLPYIEWSTDPSPWGM